MITLDVVKPYINVINIVHHHSFQNKMPPESTNRYFYTSCDAILKNWTALQLAVSNEAAGPQSKEIAQWMVDAVVQWFNENENLEGYEVADFLEQIIAQEFKLQIDDGSSDEIGTTICEFYQLCCSSKTSEEIISKIRSLPKCDLSLCQIDGERNKQSNPQNILEEQMSGMEVDNSTVQESSTKLNGANNIINEPDPEGWMVVGRKKK